MQTSYLYSGTYASVLTSRLLSSTQRELLLASTSLQEVQAVLFDTPFAPFVSDTSYFTHTTQGFVKAQVDMLRRLMPDETVFAILTLRHDYYNLKQIVHGQQAGLTDETILAKCRPLGTIAPAALLRLAETNTLRFSHSELGAVYRQVHEMIPIPHDLIDSAYFAHIRTLASIYPDSFVEQYVILTIDLHNLLMRLRVLSHPDSDVLYIDGSFVPGGSMTKAGLESLETVLIRLSRFGSKAEWRDAIEAFETTRDFTLLDRTADNYLMRFLKQASIEVHSPAPLFAYYHAMMEHAQFVETIISAHAAGLNNTTVRTLVRDSLLTYAY